MLLARLTVLTLAGSIALGNASAVEPVQDYETAIAIAARKYRIELYRTFQNDRPQYDHSIEELNQVVENWRKQGSRADDANLVEFWLTRAIEARRRGQAPPLVPRFGTPYNQSVAVSNATNSNAPVSSPAVTSRIVSNQIAPHRIVPKDGAIPSRASIEGIPTPTIEQSSRDFPTSHDGFWENEFIAPNAPRPPAHRPVDSETNAGHEIYPATTSVASRSKQLSTDDLGIGDLVSTMRIDSTAATPVTRTFQSNVESPITTQKEHAVPLPEVERIKSPQSDQHPINLELLAARVAAQNEDVTLFEVMLSEQKTWSVDRLEELVFDIEQLMRDVELTNTYLELLSLSMRERIEPLLELDYVKSEIANKIAATMKEAARNSNQYEHHRLKRLGKRISKWTTIP